jgi:hypothetical protein
MSAPLGAHVCIDHILATSSSCISSDRRQSQLASQGPVALAERLTQSLRNTGDLDLIDIDMEAYVLHIDAKACSQCMTYTGDRHPWHRTTTKSCFRRRGDRNSFNPLMSSFVYLLANGVLCFLAPSHHPLVADTGRDAVYAEPHALLGVHQLARTDCRH